MGSRAPGWERGTEPGVKQAGKPHGGGGCSGQQNSEDVHAVAANEESREATSANGTNLEQESAGESTEQVLMGESRKR